MIARDAVGDLVFASGSCFKGRPEVHHAETIGIREALSWAKTETENNTIAGSLGSNTQVRFIIELDSQIAVNAVLNREQIYSPFGGVVDECRSIIHSHNNIDIVFVKRSGNMAADCLASLSCSNPGCIFKEDYVPSSLQCILEADLK